MPFDMIAFDADDTLWHTEYLYREVEQKSLDILENYGVSRDTALAEIHRLEVDNLADFGYGIKSFVISIVESAVNLTSGAVTGRDVQAIIDLGRMMVRKEVNLLPGVREALSHLSIGRNLALVTKGDLLDQERKISISGLGGYFQHIEIVSDKTPQAYAALLARLRIAPEKFMMIGNSLRSDILPVLEIGGWAVYIPQEATWAHEHADLPEEVKRYYELPSLNELPALVEEVERK